jgi:hypothetical protein
MDSNSRRWPYLAALALPFALGAAPVLAAAQPDTLRYTIAIHDTATKLAELRSVLPTSGDAEVQLMMPVWSPGFYRVEDYAAKVQGLEARGEDGAVLTIKRPQPESVGGRNGKAREVRPHLSAPL